MSIFLYLSVDPSLTEGDILKYFIVMMEFSLSFWASVSFWFCVFWDKLAFKRILSLFIFNLVMLFFPVEKNVLRLDLLYIIWTGSYTDAGWYICLLYLFHHFNLVLSMFLYFWCVFLIGGILSLWGVGRHLATTSRLRETQRVRFMASFWKKMHASSSFDMCLCKSLK